jgi:hypothetical protein
VNVYVESNFILEIALLQEGQESCLDILATCEAGTAHLVLPAFCIAEPHETIGRRHKDRKGLLKELDSELKQLARSIAYREDVATLRNVTNLLARSADEERRRLNETFDRLLRAADIIPLDPAVLAEARRWPKLSPQDSIIYASVLTHLQVHPRAASCFLSRDREHFHDLDLVENLARHGCRMIHDFQGGSSYLQHQTHPPSPEP